MLGKSVGWGRTAALYAVDSGFIVALGVALAAWSRRQFGRSLAGLAGYFVFLAYYLSRDYSQVAQRDWQAPFFVVLGLLALEALPGWGGRVASALATAVAVSFRPQVVVLLPAVAAAID